jgi:formyltetrahydrofolate deformylase
VSTGAEYVLTLSCVDRVGIVYAVAGTLASRNCNILDSQQYGNPSTGRFFMRVHFEAEAAGRERLHEDVAQLAERFGMTWELHGTQERSRVLILVSRYEHCLNDLLYRWRIGALPADIVAVASNHDAAGSLVASYGVPFHHLPVTPPTKAAQEAKLLGLIEQYQVDLVVLARYMQILSADFCERLPGRVINIHHSFLPGFKGARPYHQAYERGVKVIGATAHYVTATLDEGPIIEQEIARVDHGLDPERLAAVGRDVECLALARAVLWHVEHRVLLDGRRTVVFR